MPFPSTATNDFLELKIRILARREEGYGVELTINGEQQFDRGLLRPTVLNWQPGLAPQEACRLLSEEFFRDPKIATAWAEARGQSKTRRISLQLDSDLPELHPLPWELLGEQGGDGRYRPLATDADTPFSRYLAGKWQHGRPIISRPLRVLLAVADPEGLQEYGLQPIGAEGECARFQQALEQIEATSVTVEVLEGRVTLDALSQKLQEGFHCLHLIAHGSYSAKREQAVLMLEDSAGQVELVPDFHFAGMLDRLEACPSLIFLASCQSATGSPVEAWRGLAPHLVKAGVPAVIAMRDVIDIQTARHFADVFYRQLLAHGLVDLAGNQARASVINADLPDAGVPALFMHLSQGRLLMLRGKPIDVQNGDQFWDVLLENIEEGDCTFFLGPGVNNGLLPSHGDMARSLARTYSYPFGNDHSLPAVTQYASTMDGLQMRKTLMHQAAMGLLHNTGLEIRKADDKLDWHEAVAMCDAESCLPARGIHSQLADLGLPLYLTTNFDDLMTLALEQKGRVVRSLSLGWRERGYGQQSAPDFDPPAIPSEPVVMHLFGHFGTSRNLSSMVLTEDDHLDFLARISRDHEYIIPPSLAASLAENALVFLGFELRDPAFRILLRGILNHLDIGRWGRSHIAVLSSSMELGERAQQNAILAVRKYLQGQKIDLFWGQSHQFVAELHHRWQRRNHG